MGPRDYNIYSNSQLPSIADDERRPAEGGRQPRASLRRHRHTPKTASAIQYNVVRVDGQKSVYLPILKQGGNSNTIEIVDGVRDRVENLRDTPEKPDRQRGLRSVAIREDGDRQRVARGRYRAGSDGGDDPGVPGVAARDISVLLSIPISCLAAFLLLNAMGSTINTMVLGGLALVLSRLIDNSVVVLENIFRHLEAGRRRHAPRPRRVAAKCTGRPGRDHHHGHRVLSRRFSFRRQQVSVHGTGARSRAGVGGVIPGRDVGGAAVLLAVHQVRAWQTRPKVSTKADGWSGCWRRSIAVTTTSLRRYDESLEKALEHPKMTVAVIMGAFVLSLALSPFLGVAFFPRTDPGQFVINVKAPSGTRIELTNDYIARVEDDIRQVVGQRRLGDDRLQYRSECRSFGDLHHELGHAHGFRAGAAERRAQDQHLRLHRSSAAEAGDRSAGSFDFLPDRRAWSIRS